MKTLEQKFIARRSKALNKKEQELQVYPETILKTTKFCHFRCTFNGVTWTGEDGLNIFTSKSMRGLYKKIRQHYKDLKLTY